MASRAERRAAHLERAARREAQEADNAFFKALMDDGRSIEDINAAVDRQTLDEADEDRAYDLLEQVGSVSDCIARGLIAEDGQHVLTITPAGWALVKSMGWEPTP